MKRSLRDQFLLHRIRAYKDEKSFEELFVAYKPAILRLLRSKMPSIQDAEDSLNTTMLRVWNYITRSNDVEHVGGLMFTIARGVISEFYRSRKTAVSIDSMQEAGVDIAATSHGEKAILASTDVRLANDLMAHMDGDERTLIMLRHFEGHSIAEIADRIGKTEGATKVALHRAMKKMRTLFQPLT